MKELQIKSVVGREVLDSRGNPTVEAEVTLMDGSVGRGIAPSGASTGKYEAKELRDGEHTRYKGKGTKNAVKNVNTVLANAIIGMDATDLYAVDRAMKYADGTEDKSNLGANSMLAVSIAVARAAATSRKIPLFQFLGGIAGNCMPVPMMNILNGGAHAANTIDVQEIMIMPVGAPTFKEGLRWCVEVFHTLAQILKLEGYTTAVGDEGGFAPNLANEEVAIQYILEAITRAGYEPKTEFMIALDVAASEWKGSKMGEYRMPKTGKVYTTDALIAHWKDLCEKYPIASIEDPLDEEDWEGWKKLTKAIGDKVQLVGDDLFVTNINRLKQGVSEECGNAILIKPNQIGTLTETIEVIKYAQKAGYATIASHRSGETEDTTIADLAVALNMGQIKTGAPSRTDRVAKYNRLIRIEDKLGKSAQYSKESIFGFHKK